ncbi:MAG TPA: Gfo/Idh/MocA family oxidoreductase [Amycolatopsis sp.]|nr:Gfo/Idh/MocA family oxidoreductase [Amycolatopsis sp.]
MTAVVAGTAFGARIHVRALRAAGIDVLGLVGRDPERTAHKAERAGVPRAFTDLRPALELTPDLVVVATPPASHAPLVRLALDAGCHVLCEKPFTLDSGEAEELAERAATAGRIGYLGHEFRFAECAALGARLLAEGAIGEPRLATFLAHGGLVADPGQAMPDWWFDEQRGGGWLGASGSHAVDRVRHWLGDVASVSARLTITSDRREVADDTFNVRFTTTSGVEGTLQSTAGAWGPGLSVSRVVGSTGTLWIDDETGLGSVEGTTGQVFVADRSKHEPVPVPDDIALRPVAGVAPQFERNVLPFVRLYRQMCAAIAGEPVTGGTRSATFADGVAEMRILDAIRESSAKDGAVIRVHS